MSEPGVVWLAVIFAVLHKQASEVVGMLDSVVGPLDCLINSFQTKLIL